jgi:PAS domain S-box-containing protein
MGDNGRWRRALEATPDILIVVDAGATIQYVSPSMTQVLGHAPEDCVGQHAYELLHPEDVPIAIGSLVGTIGTGAGVKRPVEVRARHRDGSWRRFELMADNRIDDPDIGAIVVSCRDVTDREAVLAESMSDSLYRVHALLEHSSDVILQIDAKGTVSYASPAVERVLGYSDPALLGAANALDFIHPEDREKTIATLVEAAGRSDVTPPMLMRVAHADGSWRSPRAASMTLPSAR